MESIPHLLIKLIHFLPDRALVFLTCLQALEDKHEDQPAIMPVAYAKRTIN